MYGIDSVENENEADRFLILHAEAVEDEIRAKTTFVGTFNMKKDEIKECDDRRVVNDLKKLGLVEDVPEEKESVSDSDTMEQKNDVR